MDKEEALRKLVEEEGFFKHNNYEIVEATEESCILKASITKSALNHHQQEDLQ